MKLSSQWAFKPSGFSTLATFVLGLSLIFLQEGVTYYLSFQVLGLLVIWALVSVAIHSVRRRLHFLFAYLVFVMSLIITAIISPMVVSTNSSNIVLTVIGVAVYAMMIGFAPHVKFRRIGLVLHMLKSVSSMTILVLTGLLFISESNLIPFLSRSAMLQQNTRLIDNFSDADAISADQALRLLIGGSERIDLFYGEPSFLAIVLFSCIGCVLISSRLLAYAQRGKGDDLVELNFKSDDLIILIGVLNLLYIQSFSSIIYALTVVYFAFIKGKVTRARFLKSFFFMLAMVMAFLVFSYDYFVYRLTQSDSLSFDQRFGFLQNMDMSELLIGMKDASLLPDVGIHNGLLYIIAISGFGGMLYVGSLLYSVYTLSARIKASMFLVLLVLAIMMQNGGVFSPGKTVLFSLVLLPLACAPSIERGRRSTAVFISHA